MLRNPKKFNGLVKAWNELKAECGESLYERDVKMRDGRLARAQWGRKIVMEETSTTKLNRCGEILCGPLFVSEKHSWPESNGEHMLPVLQINLDKCGRIMKMDFGTGILQVWNYQGSPENIVRVLPPEDVKKEYLVREIPEPILAIEDDSFFFTPITWRENDEGSSGAITGYGKKHFEVQEGDAGVYITGLEVKVEEKRVRKFAGQGKGKSPWQWVKQGRKSVWIPVEADKRKLKRIQMLIEKVEKLEMEIQRDFQISGSGIGGSFSPYRYFAYERPPVLLNIWPSEPHFFDAQLFYEKQPDGSFKYSFEFS